MVPDEPDKRRAGAPVDREDAFQVWASLPVGARSYAAVARAFAISPRTVERYAREGGWRQRLRAIETEAARQADAQLGRRRAEQLVEFQQLIDASCVTYARQLASGTVKITAAEFVGLIKAALLLQGEAGERVELVTASEDWMRLRGRILQAVAAYPEARLALADALEETEPGA